MNKVIVAALVATAGLCAGTAHAGNVSWSIGINTPVIGTVLSNAPVYPVPVYVQPPMVAPMPIFRPDHRPDYRPDYAAIPARLVYPRHGVAYRPVPVVYAREFEERGSRGHRHGYDERHDWRGNQRGEHDRHDRHEWRHD